MLTEPVQLSPDLLEMLEPLYQLWQLGVANTRAHFARIGQVAKSMAASDCMIHAKQMLNPPEHILLDRLCLLNE